MWVIFLMWCGIVLVGYVGYLNLIFETTSALPLVSKNFPTQQCEINGEGCYMGGGYTRKMTFIWAMSLISIPMRFIATFALFAYLMGSDNSRSFSSFLVFFGLIALVSEGVTVIAYGLEWKDANKQPEPTADTRYDRNIANSYDYCCLYGNFTAFCPNYLTYASLPPGQTSPCYGNWTLGFTELMVNPDFLLSAIVTFACFVLLFLFLIMSACGRFQTYRKATMTSGEEVLIEDSKIN
jgi:hypothetical protein